MQKTNSNDNIEYYTEGRRHSLSIDSTSHSIDIDNKPSSRRSSFEICITIEDISNNEFDIYNNKDETNTQIPIKNNKKRRRTRDKELHNISASPNVNDFLSKLFIFNNKHK